MTNRRLKQLLADAELDKAMLKDVLGKKWSAPLRGGPVLRMYRNITIYQNAERAVYLMWPVHHSVISLEKMMSHCAHG